MARPIDDRISIHPEHVLLEIQGHPLTPDEIAEEMHADNLDFFVTAATNRGMQVSLFAETEAALEWIHGGTAGDSP